MLDTECTCAPWNTDVPLDTEYTLLQGQWVEKREHRCRVGSACYADREGGLALRPSRSLGDALIPSNSTALWRSMAVINKNHLAVYRLFLSRCESMPLSAARRSSNYRPKQVFTESSLAKQWIYRGDGQAHGWEVVYKNGDDGKEAASLRRPPQ